MRHPYSVGATLFAVAVLLASFTALRADDKFSAGEMLASCQAILDSAKTAKNPDELEFENTFTSGTCWGAFLGIQQFIVMRVERGNTILKICAPPKTTLVQIIQIFDLFIQSNPKRQDEPFTKVAIAALRSAFPCK
jgi:hypothetical protein